MMAFGKKKTKAPAPGPRMDPGDVAMILGDGFDFALKQGRVPPAAFWINRAADKSPWKDTEEARRGMLALDVPLDEQQEVFNAVSVLRGGLDVATNGVITAGEAAKLHYNVTLIIRATVVAAIRWLVKTHPESFLGYETTDELIRETFIPFRQGLQDIEVRLMLAGRVPLFDAICETCFKVLEVRAKEHALLLQGATLERNWSGEFGR